MHRLCSDLARAHVLSMSYGWHSMCSWVRAMKRIETSKKRLSLKPEVIRALEKEQLEHAGGGFCFTGRCGTGASVEIKCWSDGIC